MIRHVIISHHGVNDCVTPDGSVKYDLRKEKQQMIDDIRSEVHSSFPETELRELFRLSTEELSRTVREISELTSGKQIGAKSFYWGMLLRLLLSLLIDTDRTVSACFAKNVEPEPIDPPTETFWYGLIKKLETHLSEKAIDTPIAQMRQEIPQQIRINYQRVLMIIQLLSGR